MRKKTSITMVLTIAAVLTAYISALALSNQAFAQRVTPQYTETRDEVIWAKTFESEEAHAGKVLAGEEAQVGKILAGRCQNPDGTPCTEPIPTAR
jgi:hypothetical protein